MERMTPRKIFRILLSLPLFSPFCISSTFSLHLLRRRRILFWFCIWCLSCFIEDFKHKTWLNSWILPIQNQFLSQFVPCLRPLFLLFLFSFSSEFCVHSFHFLIKSLFFFLIFIFHFIRSLHVTSVHPCQTCLYVLHLKSYLVQKFATLTQINAENSIKDAQRPSSKRRKRKGSSGAGVPNSTPPAPNKKRSPGPNFSLASQVVVRVVKL